jgi:uncharacterized damage-inducible protein DinB
MKFASCCFPANESDDRSEAKLPCRQQRLRERHGDRVQAVWVVATADQHRDASRRRGRYDACSMPSVDVLAEFFRHNSMMNSRLLDACRQLTPEQLAATATGTYGSIGATLVHVANAQSGYAARLLHTERPERLPEDPFPGFEVVAERLSQGDALLEQAVARASSDHRVQVTGDDPSETWSMPVALFLLQAINHGTEHRSHIATILTQLGVAPPEMDGWTYFLASGLMEPV